ncbi:hypothetical protein N0B51_13470 [Tsuneonella sp. YG55]|uniref:Uncharacterized protein n=1 Tax=Tsuneonella litorea TaxID=2976475 RepID=A0A9X2W3B9_9SPHN|nr:hypothetical protein [Tsuneonella litorea]MCT2559987.1 hypothetical protein [Tsuneonella litorea]
MNRSNKQIGIAGAILASLVVASSASAADRSAAGEKELAALLEGRVAGEPVDCIRDSASDGVQIIDGTAMVFRRGDTLYVNRPDGARTLDYWDLPVFHKWGGNGLCRLDHVDLYERGSHIPGPTLFLAEFVPYKKPAR